MSGYISPNHLITNSTMAFQEITSVVFNRYGDEWLCDLYEAERRIAGGSERSMDLALTRAIQARANALSDAEGN